MLSTSSLSRRRFGLGDEAPERIPQDSRLRLRSDAGVDDDEDACERSPDPPLIRKEIVLRVFSRASRTARESQAGGLGDEAPALSTLSPAMR